MPITAVLFDFDGTLADSFTAITSSTNHVRESFGLPPLSESVVREYVGYGLTNLVEQLVPSAGLAEAVARYRAHHDSVMLTETKLLPGVAETIPQLAKRGLLLAVCSNKQVHFTRKLVNHLGLSSYFQAVLGPDDVDGRPKPDPAMLLHAISLLGVYRPDVLYIGDMAIDVHTARAAGLPVWLVPGGATGKESPISAHPDRILSGFDELLTLLAAP